MKTLLIATDTFFPKKDGVTRFLQQIIPTLTSEFQVIILAPSFSSQYKEETYAGAKVIRFPVYSRFHVSSYAPVRFAYWKVKEHVRKADKVWIQSAAPLGIMTLFAARRLKKPVAAFIHSMEWEQLTHIMVKSRFLKGFLMRTLAKIEKYVYNKCDLLLTPAKNVAIELTELGIKTKKVIIPLGVDNQYFVPPQDKRQAKRSLRLDPDTTIIGYCGRLSAEKDIATLCIAYQKLQERYPKLLLLLVGDGNRNVISSKLEKGYRITGFVEDVVPYLQAMDIFVLPSLTETSSLATMEAMTVGLPVVSTYVGNIKYYIIDGKNGFLFPRGDAVYLEKKLRRLIENPELRRSFGLLARRTMVTKFYWNKTANQIKHVLSTL